MENNNPTVIPVPTGAVGIQIRGVYDGVIIWMLLDGTYINRFKDVAGYEDIAAQAAKHIEDFKASGSN